MGLAMARCIRISFKKWDYLAARIAKQLEFRSVFCD